MRMPQPSASVRSAISALARILSAVALATLRILPRIGRIAWVLRSRACLADPPALSPSTMNSSVPAAHQLRHFLEEKGHQQGRDMRAVDIGVGHDDDALIA